MQPEKNSGFSLLELLIVMGITVVIVLAAFINSSSGDRAQAIRLQSSDIALALAEARDKAAAAVPFNGAPVYGYGVFFSLTSPQSFVVYADINNNMICDDIACGCTSGCEREKVEVRILNSKTSLYGLSVGDPPTVAPGNAGNTMAVYFCPPNPNVFIFGASDTTGTNCSSVGATSQVRGDIYVGGKGGATDLNALGVVTVRKTGAVAIGFGISDTPQVGVPFTETTPAPAPNLNQVRYHWRNDSGAENANNSSTNGTENTPISGLAKASAKRLRIEVNNAGTANSSAVAYALQYRLKGSQCDSGGTWTTVPVTLTAANEHWQIAADSGNLIANASPTSNVAVSFGGTSDENIVFRAGYFMDTAGATPTLTLNMGEFTEIEYNLKATSYANDGKAYCFRVSNAGSVGNMSFSRYPEASIIGPNLTQLHYRWRNDNNSEVLATWAGPEDAKLNNMPRYKNIRLRMEVSNQGDGNSAAIPYRLEYAQRQGGSCGGGDETFLAVPTDTSAAWKISDSINLTDGTATTNVSGGLTDDAGHTFVAGQVKDNGNATTGITLSTTQLTEIEYSLQATSNALGGNFYCFRLTNAGSISAFTYKILPEVSVLTFPTVAVDTTYKYAWNDSVGWIDLRPDFSNNLYVHVGESDFYGYGKILSSPGYISFNCFTPNECLSSNYKVSRAANGDVSGWAWSENYGWISFNCLNTSSCATVNYKVNINSQTGVFTGWAWNDSIGWISFNCANIVNECTNSNYYTSLEVPTGETLFVNLSSTPSLGNVPITVSLWAAVTGSASGTINYKFDCTNDGTYDVVILNQSPSSGDASYTATNACTYNISAVYTAKVLVERGSSSNTNTVTINATQLFLPDLISQSLTYTPPSPNEDNSMTFSGTIKNDGNVASGTSSTSRLRIDINNDGGGISWDVVPATASTGTLIAGATEQETWSNVWTAVAGTHLFEICADNGGAISELNETNNCASQLFSVASLAPIVTTNAATSVTMTSATLNGSANPKGFSSTGWFRYSTTNPGTCNDTFGTRVPASGGTALGSGTSAVAYSQAASSLSAGATYYYCAIANNVYGTSFGTIQSFIAAVVPSAPTSLTAIDQNGQAALSWVAPASNGGSVISDYAIYRGTTSGTEIYLLNTGSTATTYTNTGLTNGTTYYYKVAAVNVVGTGAQSNEVSATPRLPIFTDTGFKTALAQAAVASGADDNNGFEITPTNTTANDAAYAESANTGTGNATDGCTTFNQSEDDAHDFYNFSFDTSIPAYATIDGIAATTIAKWSVQPGVNNLCLGLSWDGGTSWTAAYESTDLPTSDETSNYGSSSDKWGRSSWNISELGSTNFRLRVMIDPGGSDTTTAYLDYLAVKVYYTY